MINIVVNPQEVSTGWVLNADLETNLGIVTLHNEGSLMHGCFLGFYSPKHCVKGYLDAVKVCVKKYLAASPSQPLTLVSHPWTTGLGRTLLKDVIRLTDPHSVTEYYYEQSTLESVLDDSSSLARVYTTTKSLRANSDRLLTFKVAKPKPVNIRESQQERLMNKLSLSSWSQLAIQAPFHAFLRELTILCQETPLQPELYAGLLGKVVGLLKLTDATFSCVGLGVVRDINFDTEVISVVSGIDMREVVGLAASSGEDSLELPLEVFWSDKAQFTSELDQDFVFDDAVLAHKISRHHPGRSYLA